MSIATYFENLWRAATGAPRPDAVRIQLLLDAQLELMQSEHAAEDHAVQAAAFTAKCHMLRGRIERLMREKHGNTQDTE